MRRRLRRGPLRKRVAVRRARSSRARLGGESVEGGTRRLRLAKVAAEAREAAARLDEELEAGEYVTEFVDLSEEESSEEGEAAGAEGEETGEQESGGGRRKRERGRRGTGNQREVRQRIGGIL